MTTPTSANPNKFPEFSYIVIGGEPVIVLMPVPIDPPSRALEQAVAVQHHELRRMRDARERIREAVAD